MDKEYIVGIIEYTTEKVSLVTKMPFETVEEADECALLYVQRKGLYDLGYTYNVYVFKTMKIIKQSPHDPNIFYSDFF